MRAFAQYAYYFLVWAAFVANACFLAAALAAFLRRAGLRKTLAWTAALAAAFAAGQLFYGGAAPRGGYDNEHDFQHAGISFLRAGPSARALPSLKEVSPLAAAAVGDALSGYSLPAVPGANRLLAFLSSVLLLACLLELGFGLAAAWLGFALLYFSFLTALSANTFATAPANLFLLFSALLAAARLFAGGGKAALAWALAALFLVWTGRYELAFLPGTLLLAGLARRESVLRSPGAGAAAWLMLAAAAALCGGWALLVLAGQPYNGPAPGEALRLLSHLKYQLGSRNLGVFLPAAAGAAPFLAAGAAALALYGAWSSRDRGRALALWGVTVFWILCFSAIYVKRDEYPLQFLRHRLYYFVPFVFLFSAAWDACWRRAGGRAAAAVKWGLLAVLCALYLGANIRAAKALEPKKRTNDLEWALLLEAAEKWPAGCALVYPGDGKHHRLAVLGKYFPLLRDGCAAAPACVIKYVPPVHDVFTDSPAPPGARPGPRPLFEAAFEHRFYTVWDSEIKERIQLRFGFYRADDPGDAALPQAGPCRPDGRGADPAAARSTARARLSKDLGDRGAGLVGSGDLAGAEAVLERAVKTDPTNAEALLTLCYVRSRKKDLRPMLDDCGAAYRHSGRYPPAAGRSIASEAAALRASALAALGRREEAAAELEKALADPPPGWPGLEAARAALKKLEQKKPPPRAAAAAP